MTFLPIPEKNVPFPEDMFLEKRCDALAVLDPQGSKHGNLHQEYFRMGHVFPSRPRGAFFSGNAIAANSSSPPAGRGFPAKHAVFF
jgi:hypothetical protein